MSDVEKLSSKRVDKARDSREVRPVDLLRAMAHDIESGELVVDGVILVYMNRPKDGPWEYGAYRANVTRDQEIVALEVLKNRTVTDWRTGK